MKKTSQLLIRVSESEKGDFERASEIAGISLSSWARQILRSATVKQLQEAGEIASFLTSGKSEKKTIAK